MPVHKGSCHCHAVTFEFEAPAEGVVAWDCNCKQALISTPGLQQHDSSCRKKLQRGTSSSPGSPKLGVKAVVAAGMLRVKPSLWPPADTGSICGMKRNTHVFIPEQQFKLISGADNLGCYQVRCMPAGRVVIQLQ
jgi:hypothetical protein